jgi:hypothetical protein
MRRAWLLICLGMIAAHSARCQTGSLSPEKLANLFEYSGALQQQDITETARRKNPAVIWSANYVAPDNGLGVTTITLARGKSILPDALAQHYAKVSATNLKTPEGKPMPKLAQPIAIGDEAKGFAYLGGFGPGGIAYEATVTTADGAFDLSVNTAFSSSIDPQQSEQLRAHYDALSKKANGGMFELLQSILSGIYAEDVTIQANRHNAQPSDVSASDAGAPEGPALSRSESSAPSVHHVGVRRNYVWAGAGLAILMLICLVWAAVGRRRGRNKRQM